MLNETPYTVQNRTMPENPQAGAQSISKTASPGAEEIALSVVLSIFCVLGTVGNALAFFIYYRKREKGTSSIFILSLAVTDFLTCLINLPYTIISLLLSYRLQYDIFCKMFLFIGTFNVPLSSLIMVAIGIDRYFCICHPFIHVVTVPRAKACVIVLVFISSLLGIVPALSHAIPRHSSSNMTANSASPTVLSSINSSLVTRGPATSTTTQLVIDRLLLNPDSQIVSDLLKQEPTVKYRTEHISVLSPTSTSILSTQLSNWNNSLPTTTLPNNNVESENVDGVCSLTYNILSQQFLSVYQQVYAATYLFEFIILAILYALIYRSILVRRAWKTKRKRMSCYASHCPEPSAVGEETQLTNINGGTPETIVLKKNSGRFSSVMRDRTLQANIRTAAMLFVVTLGFIISFLPSWLIIFNVFPFKLFVFYMFYLNNVINPFIYAFMNRTFRDDLFQLLKSCFLR